MISSGMHEIRRWTENPGINTPAAKYRKPLQIRISNERDADPVSPSSGQMGRSKPRSVLVRASSHVEVLPMDVDLRARTKEQAYRVATNPLELLRDPIFVHHDVE